MSIIELPNRGVLRVVGPDAESFLQAIVTNSVVAIPPGTAVYSALLTAQGKFLHDFFCAPAPDGEGLLLDAEADRLDDLRRRLTLYRLRSKVTIDDVSGDWRVLAAVAGGIEPVEGAAVFADPRHPGMGSRALWPAAAPLPGPSADFADYERRRIALGIPDGSRDIEVEKSFLLEHRLDELHGVDFKKGCYVGQELTARLKYRGNVRKKLFACRVEGALPPPDTPVTVDGTAVGSVRTGIDDQVLAVLKLERPEGTLMAGESRLTPFQAAG